MKKLLLFLLFFLGFFTLFPLPFPLKAQDSGWVIQNFHSDISIQKSGVVDITETISVDFRNYEKHGIYRDIPYVYDTKNGEKYYTQISVVKVIQDQHDATYKVFNNGIYQRIQIGDADKTISGQHTYSITYSVKGVLQAFKTYDEFYWNVTGDQWPVFIDEASATVTLPESVQLVNQLACYQGPAGSTQTCTADKTSDHSARFFSNGLMGSHQGMTVAVAYQPHIIPILQVTRPKTFIENFFEAPSLLLVGGLILMSVGWGIYTWFRKGRDTMPFGAHETTVVEYTSPEKLTPAQIGVLMDEKADTLDVTATIIDLTGRGYLLIKELPKKWLFGSIDYELTRTSKGTNGLHAYETYLLDSIFGENKTKKVSTLKNTFYTKLSKVKDMLYEDMTGRGYFDKNPKTVRNNYMIAGGIFLGISCFAIMYAIPAESVFFTDILIGGIVFGLVLFFVSQFMPKKTAKGRELYRRIKGYKLFISTAEKYRQRFFEQKNLFNEVLPYAMVFGLTEKFAQAMKDIGLKDAALTGYYGLHPFHAGTFGNTVNDFSNSFSSAAASAPSSSGSGGGGSSGGGFGGGGGGSW